MIMDADVFVKLYKSFVRLHLDFVRLHLDLELEYGNLIYAPHLKRQSTAVEKF